MPSTVLPPATAAAKASLPCALSAGIGCLPKPEKVPPAGEGSPSTTTLATFPSDHTKKPSLARPRRIVAKKATRPSEVTGATIGRDSTLKRSNVPPPGTASPASTTGRARSASPAAEDRAANGATSAATMGTTSASMTGHYRRGGGAERCWDSARLGPSVAFVLALAGAALAPRAAEAKLRVVTTLPDLFALTRAVAGDVGAVDLIARFGQNPHDMEVRPSHMLLVRRADVLVRNGLEEDAWIDVIVRGAANPRLLRGSPNVVEASQGIRVLKVPAGHVDRSLGDVHPLGSPHYTLDPDNAVIVTGNIAAGLARGAPQHAPAFGGNPPAFFGPPPRPAPARAPRLAALSRGSHLEYLVGAIADALK